MATPSLLSQPSATLLQHLYEAPFEEDNLSSALDELRKAFEADEACISFIDLGPAARVSRRWSGQAEASAGGDEPETSWVEAALPLSEGQTLTSAGPADAAALACALYGGEGRGGERRPHLAAGVVVRTAQRLIVVGLTRRARPFGADEQGALGALLPHLRCAVRLWQRVEEERLRSHSHRLMADLVPFGLLLVDQQGRLLQANRLGEEMLRRADGLMVRDGKVTAALHRDIEALARLLSGTLPAGCQVTRLSSETPLVVVAAPLQIEQSMTGETRPTVALYVSDPDQGTDVSTELLQRVFGFTPAEARLAWLVMRGRTPKEAACELNVSWNTVRTQLRRLFAKTGTDRQATLVRALLAVVPVAA